MTRDDIIRMAREAKFQSAEFWPDDFKGLMGCVERFAALVAAKEREDIIRMAREARLGTTLTHQGGEPRVWIEGANWHDEVERFAALVAAKEREACAFAAWSTGMDLYRKQSDAREIGAACAEAIRARGRA